MKQDNFENMSLPELCDLLATETLKLLSAIENGADGVVIRDYRVAVEVIQQAIEQKRKIDRDGV